MRSAQDDPGRNSVTKVLVANRGEIAIRAFRAAYELGAAAAGRFSIRGSWFRAPFEGGRGVPDRGAGAPGARLPGSGCRRGHGGALRGGRCIRGMGTCRRTRTWPRHVRMRGSRSWGRPHGCGLAGNKARAIAAAEAAGLPTLAGVEPSTDVDGLLKAAESLTYPLVKAVAGGGVEWHAQGGSGDGSPRRGGDVYARGRGSLWRLGRVHERAVVDPRHIEVQILADAWGSVMHLFERDCSLQRRHQKVIEIAPAPNLEPELRDRMCADAVRFCEGDRLRQRGHGGVPTRSRRQLRVHRDEPAYPGRAHGDRGGHRRRPGAGAAADRGRCIPGRAWPVPGHGQAARCGAAVSDHHEDPANGFRPDAGIITTYRSPGGAGVRLDGGTTYTGAEVSGHFSSMLTKLTCRGRDFSTAVDRARRAVAEFRIRGVATNIPFLQAVLDDPEFRAGRLTTGFIETHPHLLTARSSADRGTKLLTYLADVTVNQPFGKSSWTTQPRLKLPPLPSEIPAGSRQVLLALGLSSSRSISDGERL